MRRSGILEVAVDLFSSKGISVTTRDIAHAAGITQPLIFKHFSSKEELVDTIYLEQFEGMFNQNWLTNLQDLNLSLYQRLVNFYMNYTEVIFNENWMRIYFWSAMADAEINKRYTKFIGDRIIKPIATQIRAAVSSDSEDHSDITDLEFETVYTAHSSLVYYGVRKYIFRDDPAIDRSQIVHECVASMLQGAPTVVSNYIARNCGPAPAE